MNINWFPGHMVKAKKEIKENLKLVDVVVELLDARIPYSSQNPDMDEIAGGKPRVIALNKSDLAEESVTRKWIEYFNTKGYPAVAVDSVSGKGLKELERSVREIMKDKLDLSASKGRIGRPIRVAVLGIPNVGKSSYINKVANRAAAATANKPGVTRKKQWVKAGQGIELMDTPGVLWPKFDSPEVGVNLAGTGAIRPEIIDTAELAVKLAENLRERYEKNLAQRYKLESLEGLCGYDVVKLIGKKRGCLVSGGEVDFERAALILIDEFRNGKLGRISLEEPEVLEDKSGA